MVPEGFRAERQAREQNNFLLTRDADKFRNHSFDSVDSSLSRRTYTFLDPIVSRGTRISRFAAPARGWFRGRKLTNCVSWDGTPTVCRSRIFAKTTRNKMFYGGFVVKPATVIQFLFATVPLFMLPAERNTGHTFVSSNLLPPRNRCT